MARLTMSDRLKLSELYLAERRTFDIACALGVSMTTVYDELKRGYPGELDKNQRPAYDPELAQRVTMKNIRRCGKRRRVGT